jgi:hypothetical protein
MAIAALSGVMKYLESRSPGFTEMMVCEYDALLRTSMR